MITRRAFASSTLLLACGVAAGAGTVSHEDDGSDTLERIERDSGGRLGVAVVEATGRTLAAHRADERFPMCSTFKLLACALALHRVDDGAESLDRRVRFAAADLVPYSPVTGERVGGAGMRIAELCEAAMTLSDNTAANLLLARSGGPTGVTAFVRAAGDRVTRLDRIEPALNEARPGDPRDTTSPRAMLATMRGIVLGDTLSASSRALMTQWLRDCRTGGRRLKAGLPADWIVGDKTGSGADGTGTTNDVAVVWPPRRAPLLVTAYLTRSTRSSDGRDALLARVGRLLPGLVAGR